MISLLAQRASFLPGQKAIITTHFNPDADAIGSSLAFQQYLIKLGLIVEVWVPSSLPAHFNWMKGVEDVLDFESTVQKIRMNETIDSFDWIFCLDFSGMQRLHGLSHLIKHAKAPKVVIDHHLHPEDFGTYYFHDTKSASTCELIYELMQHWGDGHCMDLDIAACIYAGMMTDTGSFRHPNTTARVHEIVAELIHFGLNTNQIHRRIFDSASVDRLQFLGHILSSRLEYLPKYHLAMMWITAEDQKQFNSQAGDTEGIVNYGLQIAGAIWSILLIERPDGIKLSFRSIEPFAVNEFASTYFEGGGHKNASGGRLSKSNLEDAKKILMEVLPLQLEQIERVKNL